MTSSLKDQAARWVDQGGGAEALNDWLQASPEHRRAYDQIDQTMRDPALVEAMRLHDARPKVVGLRPQARAGAFTRPVRGWTPALAAALVAGLLLVGVLSAPPLRERLYPVAAPRSPLLVATAPGQLRTITLSDGSRIHLNGDTRLSLAQQGGGRHARLIRGEALFDIRHDPERPFVLALDHGSLTDLGTTFNVSISGDQAAVQVYSGTVRLKGETGVATLNANQQADLTRGVVGSVSGFDAQAGDWRGGWIEARDWPLHRVVEALRRRSGVAIVVASPALESKRITGRVRLDTPREDLDALADLHGFVVRERSDGLVLTQGG